MRELLYELAGYTNPEEPVWVIWGAGNRGLDLLKYIETMYEAMIYFADNDVQKQGTKINNIVCISRNEVSKISDHAIILVSPYRSKDLYEDLHRYFPYVVPDIILEILNYYPKANGFNNFMPLGHFYSLYPDMEAGGKFEKKYLELCRSDREVLDINFNIETQLDYLEKMKELRPSLPAWTDESERANSKYRYQTDATAFCVPDATCLHFILRILNPKELS